LAPGTEMTLQDLDGLTALAGFDPAFLDHDGPTLR
jgi:hypothetical protein